MTVARNPRFANAAADTALQFTASATFDWRLISYDLEGSRAHVAMLGATGIIDLDDVAEMERGLHAIQEEVASGAFGPRIEYEDIHMNVEARLRELIGPVAGKLHTGRSRNDQVALDMHLYMRDVGIRQQRLLWHLIDALVTQAEKNPEVIIPGYTHLQAAQPILFAHHVMAYVAMLRRDWERLQDWQRRVSMSPLGAGALSGTPYPTDPALVATTLGLHGTYANSIDAVADRDFLIEYMAWASLLMVHLSRLGEELVLWSSHEFGFIRMADGYSTGSSIMPQKRNPDVAELIRGKTGRVFGSLLGLLTVMKGLPLAYHSDMQEDKEAVFNVVDTLDLLMPAATGMLSTMTLQKDRIQQRLHQDYTAATDLADMLVAHGMPFREAHHLVGRLVTQLEQDRLRFMDVTPEYLERVAPEISWGWLEKLTPDAVIGRRRQALSTGPQFVEAAVTEARRWLTHEKSEDTDYPA